VTTDVLTTPSKLGVPFARDLYRFGERLAVVAPDGTELSYTELADRVTVAAHRLGTGRRLVLISSDNALEPLVIYLAALAAGHPVLLAEPRRLAALIERYDPDVVVDAHGELRERRQGTAHELHPDLALLLSTSGSTGSPKLVRLAADGVQANAESIATYLDIRDTDRAMLSLPMHYCYGLSVINSNLARGAAVLLTGESVVDNCFWTRFRRYRATSLHGVPHTFELLDRAGFADLTLPSLRYVTQAGGRLAPDRVRRLADQGAKDGWRLYVMYGQTEATARMAYLPPELAASRPTAIGVPVPGGSFEILPSDRPDEGELVYRGPNVMLGYAEHPADLALGRTVGALRTGDLARRAPDGLYELLGRAGRFAKLFGLRIDLDHVELLLTDRGHRVACTSDDETLTIAVHNGHPAEVTDLVRRHLGLPGHVVRTVSLPDLPRLPNGKPDYPAVARLADGAMWRCDTRRSATSHSARRAGERARTVRGAYARVLGAGIDGADTFVSLGGDSLSFVRMAVELERVLGYLPSDWHLTPVRDLEALVRRRGLISWMDTDILLRAAAIIVVMGSHIGLFRVIGGAHVLLVLAGWSFARFGLTSAAPARSMLRTAVRVAVPSMLYLAWRVAVTDDVVLPNALLVNNYVREGPAAYWFVEVFVHAMLLLAAVFAIPAVARAERQHGFLVALAAFGLTLLGRLFIDYTDPFGERVFATHAVLWFFALGWLAQRSASWWQKALTAGLAYLSIPGFFLDEPSRDLLVLGGALLLVLVPRLPVPRFAVRPVGLVASASLCLYLTHYAIYPELLVWLPPWLVTAACVAAGIGIWLLIECGLRLLRNRRVEHAGAGHQ
jgi:acyl-CoA synthetase (AMP-forming)/AMP-acid ligase II